LVACMVIIGLAILITRNVDVAMGNLEKQNVVMAFMKDYTWALYDDEAIAEREKDNKKETSQKDDDSDKKSQQKDSNEDVNGINDGDYIIHNEKEAKALCDKIARLPNVEKVELVTSEEALSIAKEAMIEGQEDYFSFLDDEEYGNPMSCAAKVTMKEMDYFSETVDEIKEFEGIDYVRSQTDLADKINAIKNGLGVAGIWIIAILVIISLVIVSNTIRVTMYSRKLEISIMKAVGATDAFVRIPFIVEGMLIGIVSALISEGLLYFCYRIATETLISSLGTEDIVKYGDMAWILLLVFIGIGVFAGAIGSFIMISKYLRREGSEFAAI